MCHHDSLRVLRGGYALQCTVCSAEWHAVDHRGAPDPGRFADGFYDSRDGNIVSYLQPWPINEDEDAGRHTEGSPGSPAPAGQIDPG